MHGANKNVAVHAPASFLRTTLTVTTAPRGSPPMEAEDTAARFRTGTLTRAT
jgi:hypothetical protein|eukprot:COSAG01_NODE_6802_length_3493_cov_3.551856_2_plen_52_part_00